MIQRICRSSQNSFPSALFRGPQKPLQINSLRRHSLDKAVLPATNDLPQLVSSDSCDWSSRPEAPALQQPKGIVGDRQGEAAQGLTQQDAGCRLARRLFGLAPAEPFGNSSLPWTDQFFCVAGRYSAGQSQDFNRHFGADCAASPRLRLPGYSDFSWQLSSRLLSGI